MLETIEEHLLVGRAHGTQMNSLTVRQVDGFLVGLIVPIALLYPPHGHTTLKTIELAHNRVHRGGSPHPKPVVHDM